MKKLNPDYEFKLYDDNDILEFIKEDYDDRTLRAYKKLTIGASKADFFRYLILYKNGGIYLDLDSLILKNLDELIKDNEAVISREPPRNLYVQWMLVFCKGHPILSETIENVIINIEQNSNSKDIISLTGPGVYTDSIKKYLKYKDITGIEDKVLNNKLKSNDDLMLKNTVSLGIDYEEYAKFKIDNSWLLYIFKSHWKQEKVVGPYFFQFLYLLILLFIIYILYKKI